MFFMILYRVGLSLTAGADCQDSRLSVVENVSAPLMNDCSMEVDGRKYMR